MMQWTTVNRELMITDRQRSGYDYRIRELNDGSVLLIAEGRISDGKPSTQRLNCADVRQAMNMAEQVERDTA
jgi:hypothetical protein